MTLFLLYYTDLNRGVIRASQLVTTNRLPNVLQSSTKYVNATFITILTWLIVNRLDRQIRLGQGHLGSGHIRFRPWTSSPFHCKINYPFMLLLFSPFMFHVFFLLQPFNYFICLFFSPILSKDELQNEHVLMKKKKKKTCHWDILIGFFTRETTYLIDSTNIV